MTLETLQSNLGLMAYPLMICSLLATAILLERLFVLSVATGRKNLIPDSQIFLQSHHEQPKAVREELAALWLQQKQLQLVSGLRVLQIIAALAPLLGLLGTVLGLIVVFDGIGEQQGPIQPSMLADGLGIAMRTTAAGLIIAVPALAGAQGFQLWAESLIRGCEHAMNINSLALEGRPLEPNNSPTVI